LPPSLNRQIIGDVYLTA